MVLLEKLYLSYKPGTSLFNFNFVFVRLYLCCELSLSIFGGLQVDPQLLFLQSQLHRNDIQHEHLHTLCGCAYKCVAHS